MFCLKLDVFRKRLNEVLGARPYSALYLRFVALLRDLAIASTDRSVCRLLARVSRVDVLMIDDWAMAR